MQRKIKITDDGSSTIYIPEMDENYHSHHGAIQEARHVFLKHGLEYTGKKKIAVFEMGFGTGLNALLTYVYAKENGVEIDYSGIEAYPVEDELIQGLNYVKEIGEEYREIFNTMHSVPWGTKHNLDANFSLTKLHEKIEAHVPQQEAFDVVYFDAFGPRAQSDMWDYSILEKMHALLKPGGVLVTYCAMGQFKRNLKALGFTVESLPGPPGKREMTRGIKL